jgi:hypothetical protein
VKAAEGFKWVRCLDCGEQYEIAHNKYNPAPPPCVIRKPDGKKCNGRLEVMKNVGLMRPEERQETIVTHNELDDMLAPKGGLDRFLS